MAIGVATITMLSTATVVALAAVTSRVDVAAGKTPTIKGAAPIQSTLDRSSGRVVNQLSVFLERWTNTAETEDVKGYQ
jgi:hypothetical protein